MLFFAFADAFSQKNIFKTYRNECSELFGIDLTMPKGFKVVDGMTPFRVNEKYNIGMFYQVALESKDKECLILFPYFCVYPNHDSITKTMAYEELKAALNVYSHKELRMELVNGKFMMQGESNLTNTPIEANLAKQVKVIASEDMTDYFNADSILTWKVPLLNWSSSNLPSRYKETYKECIGLYVLKRGHPSAMIKILMTEEGKKNSHEYMQALFKSIHYSNL